MLLCLASASFYGKKKKDKMIFRAKYGDEKKDQKVDISDQNVVETFCWYSAHLRLLSKSSLKGF